MDPSLHAVQQQQAQWTTMSAGPQLQPNYYQQQQQQQQQAPSYQSHHHHQPTTLEEIRTLWIGDLQYWVDENYLTTCFAHTGEVLSIKIIRNKITGQPEGYGFVEFVSHAAAERILQTYNGTLMPGTEQPFRLNWASFGIGERRPDAGPEHSIFVGDLAPDVTDYLLQETFREQYPSVRGAKVVTDPNTGRSKGYGFVKFSDEMERNRAMSEMNGVYCSTRPMRISAATPKKATGFQQQYPAAKAIYPATAYTTPAVQPFPAVDNDINNTTIFVGGLDPNVTDEELRQTFAQFGELVYVKIPPGKGCGFVQYGTRQSAEEAMRLNGTMIGQQVIRLSWGRSMTTKQDQPGAWAQPADPNQWASAYYGYGQGYDAYAYGAAQDPSLYAYGAYAGYGQYPQQAEGMQEMVAMAVTAPAVEQREEPYDPLATPDVDKLNAAYLSVHGSTMVGRPLWLKTSALSQQA
ncbi:Polyadenylate-binding protein RBP47B' [Thalictrum thalictroides]|uniref:Polyadenylate-binding protein RBP47B n=1 Tax=Thalictrum thalictroides TaxID=46969 RepID=A0A7J6VHQ8_THATH|nr:Polyadenylate-binding protein RBP47B' [Thalictrum thalictroides]